jgi:hypothetical protein
MASKCFSSSTTYFWSINEKFSRIYNFLDYVNQLIPPFIGTAEEILILAVTINLYMKILGNYFLIYPKTKVDSFKLVQAIELFGSNFPVIIVLYLLTIFMAKHYSTFSGIASAQ